MTISVSSTLCLFPANTLLVDAGYVNHEEAIEKANTEHRKYQANTLSPVEESYLKSIKTVEKTAKKKSKE